MAAPRTPGIGALVERQATRWRVSERLVRPQGEEPPEPCVAVSRLPYSGGHEVAGRVAARLDYGLFDRQILQEVAREDDAPAWIVEGLDERRRSLVDRFVADVFRHHPLTDDELLRRVARVITTIGRRGHSVVVGRGAAFLLEPKHALRVLVVAPAAVRAERRMKQRGETLDAARRGLAEDDRTRHTFLERNFRVDQNDPTLYDVVVNTEHLDPDAAAAVVVEAFRRRFPSAAGIPA